MNICFKLASSLFWRRNVAKSTGSKMIFRFDLFFHFSFLFCWNWMIHSFACFTFRIEVIHSCVIWAPSAIGWRRSSKLKIIKSEDFEWELIQTQIHGIMEKKDWKVWRDTNIISDPRARRFNVFGNIHWKDFCVFRSARTSWNTFVATAGAIVLVTV